ncbi:MAG: hypothetical protein HYZ36_07250 [Pedosphaera parvula]|nr:hypothetical protein [Verrucomicrobiota bacterium]MBI3192445.1 hypothetical protein [Pedosphaera parvula]
MSIKSLEEAFEALRSLPAKQQRAACEFIGSLRPASHDPPRRKPTLKQRTYGRRRHPIKPRRMGDWLLEDGLWVYHGEVAAGWDDKDGRRLEYQRLLGRVRRDLRSTTDPT